MDISFSYDDVPTIYRFSQDNTQMRLILGPFGSGKSSGAIVFEIIKRACEQAPWKSDGVSRTRWAVIRATNRRLDDTTLVTWDYWMKKFGLVGEYGHYAKTKRNFKFKMWGSHSNGSNRYPVEAEVLFRPLDDPDDVENLLSLELTGAAFNELKELGARSIWDTMLGRTGRYPPVEEGGCTWSGIWGDSNPPDTDHWIYQLFEEERPLYCPVCVMPDGGSVTYTPREDKGIPVPPKCPVCGRTEIEGIPATAIYKQPSGRGIDGVPPENLKNLEKGYYSKQMAGHDPAWINVYIDGRYGYVRDGKPVYENWDDKRHLPAGKDNELHSSYPLICGWDSTGNKQGWSFNQWFPDGKFFTYDELYQEDTDSKTFLQDTIKPFVWGHYNGFPWSRIHVIQDPASKRSDSVPTNAKKEAKLLGIDNVYKAFANNWDARFGAVNRLLLLGTYQLNRRCKLLHKGFLGEYCIERKQVSGKQVYKDEPAKTKASHVHDSLQYAAMGPSREESEGMGFHISSRDHSSRINLGAHL